MGNYIKIMSENIIDYIDKKYHTFGVHRYLYITNKNIINNWTGLYYIMLFFVS